jgi:hypothetical protein
MGIKDKLPLIRSEKQITRIFGYVVYAFAILLLINIWSSSDTLDTPPATPTPEASTQAATSEAATATQTPEPTAEPTSDQPKLGSYENPVPVSEAFLSNTGALRITMLEVERGASVNNAIKEANMFNDDQDSGNEYMFVKIRFEYLEGDDEFHLSSSDFEAYANNVECEDPLVLVMPDDRPEMQSVTMMPGGTVEKWKCFEVPSGARVTIAYNRLLAPAYYFDVGSD